LESVSAGIRSCQDKLAAHQHINFKQQQAQLLLFFCVFFCAFRIFFAFVFIAFATATFKAST